MNKKGFTLVELLAVIVILAVIMLVAVTAIGPVIERANKGAFASSAQMILAAAENAYTAEQLKANPKIARSGDTCVAVQSLINAGYFDPKGKSYTGSVLVNASDTGVLTTTLFLSEGSYHINGKKASEIGVDAVVASANSKETKCGASYTPTGDNALK